MTRWKQSLINKVTGKWPEIYHQLISYFLSAFSEKISFLFLSFLIDYTPIKIYTSLFLSKGVKASVVWERDGRKQTEIQRSWRAWPLGHFYIDPSLLLSRTVRRCPRGWGQLLTGVTDRIFSDCKLNCPYLTWAFAYKISQRPPFTHNNVTVFVYLHRWVLCREVSDWRLGQGSVCNSNIL